MHNITGIKQAIAFMIKHEYNCDVLDSSTDYYDIPNVVALVAPIPPVHLTSAGSGSHFSFPIHVDELDPLCI